MTKARASGLTRERLANALGDLPARRLALIVAPAGYGKTTLLTHIAASCDAPVAWWRAQDSHAEPQALLADVQLALSSVLDLPAQRWERADDAVAAILDAGRERVLLVIDDLHALEGTEAEGVLHQLVAMAPRGLTVVAAARWPPGWDLSRLRVGGEVVDLGADDLRFRSWEVEQLFRDVYGAPLRPEDLSALTRRTEGWAAGLQLFHLATSAKPAAERRRSIHAMGSRLPLVREYLVRNVIDDLPERLRIFLQETCVLGRLNGPVCDELLGRTGSQALLEELERRQLLTFSLGDGGWYRCHEVLRAHLEAVYLDTTSDAQARSRYRWAGALLEGAGAVSDAVHAYSRAEDWEAVGRLLGRKGEELSEGPADWVTGLPPGLLHRDPWLMLAEARRHRAAGRWQEAIAAYQPAEEAMADTASADYCRRERVALSAWLDPAPVPLGGWVGALRRLLARGAAPETDAGGDRSPLAAFVAGLGALAGGRVEPARTLLPAAAEHPASSPVLSAGARLAGAVAGMLSGYDETDEVESAAEALDQLGLVGVTRITPAVLALSGRGDGAREAAAARSDCRRDGNVWGEAAAGLLEGWARLAHGGIAGPPRAREPLQAAALQFERLGAAVPQALAASLLALARVRAGDAGVRLEAQRAEAASRALGATGAQAVAMLALAESDSTRRASLLIESRSLLAECGLVLPLSPLDEMHAPPEGPVPAAVRCFGGFSLTMRGGPVDLSGLKPMARRTLRLLAMHAPEWVHREVLVSALWPDADLETGTRNLQVAISSLRHAIEPGSPRGASTLIVRDEHAYRLELPPGAWVDHIELDKAMGRARVARARGDAVTTKAALNGVLDLYAGPLLPEDGPASWVTGHRTRYASTVSLAASWLAELHVQNEDHAAAVDVCERGLAVDRYRDALWRTLVIAHERAGDVAAAAWTRSQYTGVLDELGVGLG